MAFEAIRPLEKLHDPAVTMCVAAGSLRSRRRRHIFITVRPFLLEHDLPWWRPKRSVNIDIGRDEDEGRLRITPGGEHILIGAARNPRIAFVKFEAFRWIPREAFRPTAVEFDYREDEWLEITLPRWARKSPGRLSSPLVRAMQRTTP